MFNAVCDDVAGRGSDQATYTLMPGHEALFDCIERDLVRPVLGYHVLSAVRVRIKRRAGKRFGRSREIAFSVERTDPNKQVFFSRSYVVVLRTLPDNHPRMIEVLVTKPNGRGRPRAVLGAYIGPRIPTDWSVYREWMRNVVLKDLGWSITYDTVRQRMVYAPPMRKF